VAATQVRPRVAKVKFSGVDEPIVTRERVASGMRVATVDTLRALRDASMETAYFAVLSVAALVVTTAVAVLVVGGLGWLAWSWVRSFF
jgi:hypothetical protein